MNSIVPLVQFLSLSKRCATYWCDILSGTNQLFSFKKRVKGDFGFMIRVDWKEMVCDFLTIYFPTHDHPVVFKVGIQPHKITLGNPMVEVA